MYKSITYLLAILLAVTLVQHCTRVAPRNIRPTSYRELQEL